MITVPTSAGLADVEDLGVVLMHEHLFVRTETLHWSWPGFGGWNEEAGLIAARDRLAWLKLAGVDAILDMTVPGLGRDPALVARAAEGTGVRVLFATGLFTADVLPFPFQMRGPYGPLDGDDRLLESLFEQDLTEGMAGTGIRAAVLSLVTGPAGMAGDGERLARAVASVAARTGTVVCTQAHAPTRRGLDQLRVFAAHEVPPERVLIGGCSEAPDLDYLQALAAAGAWLGWDGCGQSMDVPLEAQLDMLAELCWRGHGDRVMLSHDRALFSDHWTEAEVATALPGWRHASIHGRVLPGLRDRGVPDDVIDQILAHNPRDFLAMASPATAVAGGGRAGAAPGTGGELERATASLRSGGVTAAPEYPGQVPLVGRERELRVLRRLIAASPLVTVCGPAGTGKTRLLHAMLPILAADYPGGVYLAEVGDLDQPELVTSRVAEAVGAFHDPGVPLPDTLAEALAGRRVLLALDGCESLAGACAALCDRLLAGLPGLRVIAASREPLRAETETAWAIPPLPVPPPDQASAGECALAPAVALMAARAGAGFALDSESDMAAAATISRILGGMPLAMELAAARFPGTGAQAACEAIMARLGRPVAAGPQGALDVVLDWTHGLLSMPAQLLLRRLSVLVGWSLEMAERVCADDVLPAAEVTGLLAELAGAALIVPEPAAPGPARFRMPGAVRDWAAVRLAAAGEADAVRRRLRDYVTRLAGYVSSIGTGQVPAAWPVLPEVVRSSMVDAANIRAVLGWCAEHGDAETGLRICTSLQLPWMIHGAWVEGSSWLDRLGEAGGADAPDSVLGPALAVRAQLALDADDYPRALACGQAGLERCRAAGDGRYTATALDALARVAVQAGRPDDALRYSAEALELTRAPGDRWTRCFALGSQALALAALGRLAEAAEPTRAGLALMEEVDNQFLATVFRLALGNLAWATGDLAGARAHYLAALPVAREVLGAPRAARCLAYLGRIAIGQDDPVQAREYLTESLRLSLDSGSRSGTIRALRAFAALLLREGQPDRAVQVIAAVTTMCEAALQQPPSPRRYLDAAASLGDGEADRLWLAGLELTSRDAAALALQPPVAAPAGSRLSG